MNNDTSYPGKASLSENKIDGNNYSTQPSDSSENLQTPGIPENPENYPLDNDVMENVRELATIPAIEVISRAAIMLMSAAAEKLGLSHPNPEDSPTLDLDEARRLITSLAGLITASVEYLGPHAAPFRDGLQALQKAFREASVYPDKPGEGPGEKFTGPVYL